MVKKIIESLLLLGRQRFSILSNEQIELRINEGDFKVVPHVLTNNL